MSVKGYLLGLLGIVGVSNTTKAAVDEYTKDNIPNKENPEMVADTLFVNNTRELPDYIVSPKDAVENLKSSVKYMRVDHVSGIAAEYPHLQYGANYEALTDEGKPVVIVASFYEGMATEANLQEMAFASHLMGYTKAIARGDLAITPQQQREIELFYTILSSCRENGSSVLDSIYNSLNQFKQSVAKDGKKLSEHQERLGLKKLAEESINLKGCDGSGTNKYTFALGTNEDLSHPTSQQDFEMVMDGIANFYKELAIKDAIDKYSEKLKIEANKEKHGKKKRKDTPQEQIETLDSVISRASTQASQVTAMARDLAASVNRASKYIGYTKEDIEKNKKYALSLFEAMETGHVDKAKAVSYFQNMGENKYMNDLNGKYFLQNKTHVEELGVSQSNKSSTGVTKTATRDVR